MIERWRNSSLTVIYKKKVPGASRAIFDPITTKRLTPPPQSINNQLTNHPPPPTTTGK
jgi:hypothetical protein